MAFLVALFQSRLSAAWRHAIRRLEPDCPVVLAIWTIHFNSPAMRNTLVHLSVRRGDVFFVEAFFDQQEYRTMGRRGLHALWIQQ